MTLTQTEKITVIITTHYIEEARQANVVGLMRRGRLLAENSPEDLLLEHNLETLEEVFLKLCMSDSSLRAAALAGGSCLSDVAIENLHKSESNVSKAGNNGIAKFSSNYSIYSAESVNPTTVSTVSLVANQKDRFKALTPADNTGAKQKRVKKSLSWGEWWSTTTALFWKNCTRLRRNIPVLLFQFALPAIQVILFCICIGADPFNIPVAIVNEENPPLLSKLFLDKLDPYLVQQVSPSFCSLASLTHVLCHTEQLHELHRSHRRRKEGRDVGRAAHKGPIQHQPQQTVSLFVPMAQVTQECTEADSCLASHD